MAVSGQTTQFVYDGDGNLVKKIKPDNSKTIYVGGIYEVDKTSGGSVTRTVTYYPAAAGATLAPHCVWCSAGVRINSTLYYTLKDHLGSASVVTDANGVTITSGEQRYYPYGETRLTSTMYTDKLFTGQREMAGLGIYHYGARFYSPKLGRFLSADSITPNPANPHSLNRYSYVLGNPLKYTDPTGHKECADTDNQGNCLTGTQVLTRHIQSKYKVKIKGRWDEDELLLLGSSLDKTARYLGGADNLNELITLAAQRSDKNATTITILNVLGTTYTPGSRARAAWCGNDGNCGTNTIVYADGIFDTSYQNSTAFRRPATFSYEERVQVTMAHEFVHVFADARPSAVSIYGYRGLGSEEDMANTVAVHVVSQGAAWPGHEAQTQFSVDAVRFFTLPYGISP